MGEVLDLLKAEGYKWNDLQVLRYDPKRPDLFPPPYLSKLYFLAKNSGRRSSLGILPNLYCGMQNLDHDSICAYLTNRPLIILAQWTSPTEFTPLGLAFVCTYGGIAGQMQAMVGYGYFLPAWGKPSVLPLFLLGLAYLFNEVNPQSGLLAIHGSRYSSNDRTARLIKQAGFVDDGRVPRWMIQNGKLVDMIVSTLLVERFEERALTLLEGMVNGEGSIESGAIASRLPRSPL